MRLKMGSGASKTKNISEEGNPSKNNNSASGLKTNAKSGNINSDNIETEMETEKNNNLAASDDSEDGDSDQSEEGEDNSKNTQRRKQIPKTIEEYRELEVKHLVNSQILLETLVESSKAGDNDKVHSTLVAIKKMYTKLRGAPITMRQEYRQKYAKIITEHGVYVPLVCDKIVQILRDENFQKSKDDVIASKNFSFVNVNLIAILNGSDCSDIFREAYGSHEPLMMIMSEKLVEWAESHLNKSLPKEEEGFIKSFLGIAHNLAILPSNIPVLRKHGYVHSCLPYLDSRFVMYKLSALATLADIVNEEECELIKANEKSIALLLRKLDAASHRKSRRESGWSAAELGRTVARLARNDNNKKLLVDLGCLPLLLNLATSKIPIEQEESIEALWVLAFDEENQPKMVAEPNLIETIDKLKQTTVGNVKKLCNGILWTLQKVLRVDENFKHLVEIYETKKEESKPVNHITKQGHVMISYQWDHQSMMKNVTSELRKDNWTVWMDIDNMEGSTLQAMANAIEGAKLVICCMSQKYKDSPNCRAEAEYAFQLRRPIIPLIMERGYRPDGWLGFILGAKLFYDFSGKYSFESRIDGLIKAVQQIYDPQSVGGSGGKEILAPPPPHQPAMETTDGPKHKQRTVQVHSSQNNVNDDKILQWSSKDVEIWLKKHNVDSNEELKALTGMELVFLRDLRLEAPEFFYRTLDEKLKIKKLSKIAVFSKAIMDLC